MTYHPPVAQSIQLVDDQGRLVQVTVELVPGGPRPFAGSSVGLVFNVTATRQGHLLHGSTWGIDDKCLVFWPGYAAPKAKEDNLPFYEFGILLLFYRRFPAILTEESTEHLIDATHGPFFERLYRLRELGYDPDDPLDAIEVEIAEFLMWVFRINAAQDAASERRLTTKDVKLREFALQAVRDSWSLKWTRYEPLLRTRYQSNDEQLASVFPALEQFYDAVEDLSDDLNKILLANLPRFRAFLYRITNLGNLALAAVTLRHAENQRTPAASAPRADAAQSPKAALRIAAIELRNIRCFSALDVSLDTESGHADWVLILGENARGKSTLLRALALGLSHEDDANALKKMLPGAFLRDGASEGSIKLTLVDQDNNTYESLTTLTPDRTAPDKERLGRRPASHPEPPWDQVFVCGYGTQRTRTADSSHDGYRVLEAVRSLFDDDSVLQNPELVLRRRESDEQTRMAHKLLKILMLNGNQANVRLSMERGLELLGPWGRQPLSSLSDGYRSTTQWVIDLIGWLIYAGRFQRDEDMTGIVLLDELEQHLHPKWQRYIIKRLSAQFPRIQFIASTHTPMIAVGLADHDHAWLLRLEQHERGATGRRMDPKRLEGKRADQVLTSEAFGLATSRSPKSAHRIPRYAELMARPQRTPEEERELHDLRDRLQEDLVLGETPYEQLVEKAVRKAIGELSQTPPTEPAAGDEVTELELRKQLQELLLDKEPPA